jgi:hypothetical protein
LRAHFHFGRFLRREKIAKDTTSRLRHMALPTQVIGFT